MRVGGIKEIATNARVIAATNKNLEHEVERGAFGPISLSAAGDSIVIPPLRVRRGDILPLVSHFLELFNKRYGFRRNISPEAFDCPIQPVSQPGNTQPAPECDGVPGCDDTGRCDQTGGSPCEACRDS